ncbi:MAG: SDR family NAD(P)-dependent oxidoreductase, partial [Bacteroidota bacterium]|nr:SDR family NAD(P)-dependent oxidoreductase [Kiloniellaceae bacterium]
MFQSDLLKGKRILITGGGTGLGKSMGRRVLELGATLVICGRREGVLEATKAEFDADFPDRTRAIPCDLRDPAAVDALVEAIWQEGPLDALVNNAAGNFLARSE